MPCLIITPEIKKLQSYFPGETLSSITNMIGIWQEREMEKGNTSITLESIPEASVLRELYADVRQADKMTIKFSKEEFESMLDDNNIPQQLQNLCTRLGVHIKVNRKTRTFELSGTGASAEDMRAFKAVAVDVVYGGDEVAEKAFGMTPRERLAALIDYESRARRIRNKDAAMMN